MTELLLTVDEVAEATRMSVKFVRRATSSGDLSSVRLGRAVRVRREDLVSYIAQHVSTRANSEVDVDA